MAKRQGIKIIYFVVGIIVLITVLIYFFNYQKPAVDFSSKDVWNGEFLNTATTTGITETVKADPLKLGNSKEFSDKTLNFSFRYPSDLNVSRFPKDEGEVILVQTDKGRGFQIMISSFDEPGSVLTEERIKQDIPDLVIKDVQTLLLGDNGRGLAFISDNENFDGNSREVWFIYKNHFYQISTYTNLDPLLQSVLNTWKFE